MQLVHSGCPGTVYYYGFNPYTQAYENLNPAGSSSDTYNSFDTEFDVIACASFTHVKIIFNFPNPNGVGVIVNFGESYTWTSNCTGQPFSLTWHVISTPSLQLNVPSSLYFPACGNSGYQINGISTSGGNGQIYYSYNFITGNGNVTGSPNGQPIVSELYSNSQLNVTVHDSFCTVNDTIEIISALTEPMYAEVCLLTIDSTNSHNLVTWEKNPSMGIVSYRIHKQSALTSQYEMIHEQAYTVLSEYVDLSSNPNQEIARYKISALDSCGNESTISPNHTAILLSSNLGASSVNLSWNPYEGFSYPNFEIWRSLNGGVSYNLLANVANNTFAYIDNNAPQQAYYQVRINNGIGCTTTKSSFNQIKSNIVDQAGNSAAIVEVNSGDDFSIFPNPTNDIFFLKSNQSQIGNKFELVDNSGRIVLSGVLQSDNQSIDVAKLSRGIYNLNMLGSHLKTMKLVKN